MRGAKPTDLGWSSWVRVVGEIRRDVRRDHLSVVAAGVAFFGLFALPPTLVAMVSIYGLIADPAEIQTQVEAVASAAPESVQDMLRSQLTRIVSTSSTSLGLGAALSLLLAIWSAMKGMKSLVQAVNIAYDQPEERGFFRFNGLVLLLTAGAILLAVVAIGLVAVVPAVLSRVGLGGVAYGAVSILRWPVLAVTVIAGLSVVYRYAPSRPKRRWRWVTPGSIVATALWLVGSGLFSYYVSHFASYNETYGSLGAVIITLLWFFLTAFAVLLGAELNAEIESEMPRYRGTEDARSAGRTR